MKEAVLGAKESPSAGPMDQIVVPPTGLPSASVQPKAAPPQSCTSMPRCRLYQACIAFGSLALKKMPPIPVARFMCTSRGKMRRSRGPILLLYPRPAQRPMTGCLLYCRIRAFEGDLVELETAGHGPGDLPAGGDGPGGG